MGKGMAARPRLLVVDDEVDILSALANFLQGSLDVDVVTAESAAAGLEELRKGTIDLVISDYRMPVMDGLHFLRRAGEMHPELPRILLTAFPDMQLAISALNQAKISQFLTKPVDPEHLRTVVQTLLSSSRRARLAQTAFQRSANAATEGATNAGSP
jgi:DNA-binding NtrC family response regulator